MKKQAMVLSAALSIASLTGSMASCAANQPDDRVIKEEPASFCYRTLGEITCYAAPQPQMGPIVALPPEPVQKEGEPLAEPAAEPLPAAPAQAPPSEPATTDKSQPLSLKPHA